MTINDAVAEVLDAIGDDEEYAAGRAELLLADRALRNGTTAEARVHLVRARNSSTRRARCSPATLEPAEGGAARMLTPEERAALYRVEAAAHRAVAARCDMMAAAVKLAESMRRFAAAVQAGYDGEVAAHPDLAELNVRLDGYYGPA
jgi:hypothetical protein